MATIEKTAIQPGQVVKFIYHNRPRTVRVEHRGSDYIQGENIHGAERKHSTYSLSKIPTRLITLIQ